MNNSLITSWDAQKITGIPSPAITAAVHRGALPARKAFKGDREVFLFSMVDLQQFRLSSAAGCYEIETVSTPLAEITFDKVYQLRASTSLKVIQNYAAAIRDGAQFPPVLLVRIDGRLVLVDGFHRVHAFTLAGRDSILAKVVEHCGSPEAFELALRANRAHGLQRSAADVRHMVTAMLARPEYAQLTSRQLAPLCGVSHNTLCRYRRRMIAPPERANHPVTDNTGTPSWIVAKIKSLASALAATHPEVAKIIITETAKIA